MNKKICINIIFLIGIGCRLFAQSDYKNAIYKGGNISKTIEEYYIRNYWNPLSKQCLDGDMHIKWQVDTFGKVVD